MLMGLDPGPRRTGAAWRCVTLLVAGVLGTYPATVRSQAPDQRRALDALRDTLQSITDTFALRERETTLLGFARRSASDPAFHARLGHIALRRGELSGASHLDHAAAEFRWAAKLAPQWPYAWLGVGYAEFALGGRLAAAGETASERRAVLSREAYSRAAQALARAVTLEPGFAPRLEELARRALRGGMQDHSVEKASVVRDALRRATAPASRAPRLLLALGRVERELHDSAALKTFASYLGTGENRALGLLELGRTQLLRGDLSGALRYLAAAADDDPVAVVEFRADLAPIASAEELAEFDRRRGSARADFVRRFWTSRDRLELRQDGERLAEHLRRLEVARREFLVVMSDSTDRLDDRGRILVRHGDPDDRASLLVPGVEPNESWRYGRDLVLHFASRQAPNDYRLVESVLDVPDARAASGGESGGATPVGQSLGSPAEQIFRSRSALSPIYGQVPPRRPEQVADVLSRERALGRRGIRIGTGSDSYRLRFAPELNAWGAVVVAGGVGAMPAVQVVFAIPGYAIEPASGAVGVVYPVRIRFVALDSAGTVIAAVDSVSRIVLGGPIPPNRSLVGRVAVPVRPGRLRVHAAVQYGERAGSEFGIDTILVPSPGGGELAGGDLLIGSDRSRIAVQLGDGADFRVAPGGVVRRSEGLGLAVEVFGLVPGSRANVRVLIADREGWGPDDQAALRWRPFPHRQAASEVVRSSGAGPIVSWRASLPLNRVAPGRYWLAVVITDPTGKVVRREARLEVETP